jgi:hypothetical protein
MFSEKKEVFNKDMFCGNQNCSRKGIDLPINEFYINRTTCKSCDTERARRRNRIEWSRRQAIIEKYLGDKCVICGSGNRLSSHEVFGQPHKHLIDTPVNEIEANCKSGKFERVCEKCHRKIHSLIGKGIRDWSRIKFILEVFYKTNPPQQQNTHLVAWHKWLRSNHEGKQLVMPLNL